jgi:membrane-associated phospholipid phosphatase
VRHWYPHAFFLFCFEELHDLAHLIFPGWFDAWLIAFDHWLAGVHPTVWLEQFARPAWNDFMQAAYMTYFFYLVILAGILYARAERQAYWTVMTCSIAAYAMGYVVAILFPIESPYHSLAALQRGPLSGGAATAVIGFVERFGRVHGAAFPSAHVSGSFVALLGAWRYRRWLFWIFLPFFLCMLVSTVYGRYHYIADGLAGLAVGAVGFWLGSRLMRLRGACPPLAR